MTTIDEPCTMISTAEYNLLLAIAIRAPKILATGGHFQFDELIYKYKAAAKLNKNLVRIENRKYRKLLDILEAAEALIEVETNGDPNEENYERLEDFPDFYGKLEKAIKAWESTEKQS